MNPEKELTKLFNYCLDPDRILALLMESQNDAWKLQLIENYEDALIERLWELLGQLEEMGVCESDAQILAERFWSSIIKKRLRYYQQHPPGLFPTNPAPISFRSAHT